MQALLSAAIVGAGGHFSRWKLTEMTGFVETLHCSIYAQVSCSCFYTQCSLSDTDYLARATHLAMYIEYMKPMIECCLKCVGWL